MQIAQGTECPVMPQAYAAERKGVAPAVVVALSQSGANNPNDHENVTRLVVARKLAALKGCEFAGEYDASERYGNPLFFVPSHTIIGVEKAHALGILGEGDLFGGVVPHDFVATKSITHALVDDHARAPEGWSFEFTQLVQDAVLRGYSAFAPADARSAGRRLLDHGSVRVKPALAIGGRGQFVATDRDALDGVLDRIDPDELTRCGVVVEENLAEVTTYSVGRVVVDDLIATYVGTQNLTIDHGGAEVYGGSDLTVARGEFDALLALQLSAEARLAVTHARVYDAAATRCFGGFIASRRNYDVALGVDPKTGAERCGVLEQSWRLGGASGAEVAALEVFRHDPGAQAVRTACVEVYGESRPPAGAVVYFDGIDAKVGHILKYSVVEPYVDA